MRARIFSNFFLYYFVSLIGVPLSLWQMVHFISRYELEPKMIEPQSAINDLMFQGGFIDCGTTELMKRHYDIDYNDEIYRNLRQAFSGPEKEIALAASCDKCFGVKPPEYLFEWPNTCSESEGDPKNAELDVFFLIKSAPGNFQRRQALRHSWLVNRKIASQPHRYRYGFFSGLSRDVHLDPEAMKTVSEIKEKCRHVFCQQDADLEKKIDSYKQKFEQFWQSISGVNVKVVRDPLETFDLQLGEAMTYNDVIIGDNFIDSYNNLTHKSLSALQWTRKFCSRAKFVVSLDDDTFVFPDRLLSLLERFKGEKMFLGGNRMYGEPNRDFGSKWYISPEVFAPNKTPDFYNGALYVMGRDTVDVLINTMPNIKVTALGTQLDDFILTGFARALAGIKDTHMCQLSVGSHRWRRFRLHQLAPWIVAFLSNAVNTNHVNRAILAASENDLDPLDNVLKNIY